MPTMTAAFLAARFRQKPNTSRARQAFTHTRILGEHTANIKRLYSCDFLRLERRPSRPGRTGERNSSLHLPTLQHLNRKTDLYSRNLRLARTTFDVGKQ